MWRPVRPGKPGNAARATFDAYEADIRAIIGAILDLPRGKPTIVRAMDGYIPMHGIWRASGVYATYWLFWDNHNQAIHRACAEGDISAARVYDAFNSPDHSQDPRDKEHISSDHIHTSWAGRDAIAEAFRALGQAPVKR